MPDLGRGGSSPLHRTKEVLSNLKLDATVSLMDNIYRKSEKIKDYNGYYKRARPSENCVFCSGEKPPINIESLNLQKLMIIKNDFPFDFWDMKKVKEHLMAIPMRHINCVSRLNVDEFSELNKIMSYFSNNGYDIFVRNSNSVIKSIEHLHFHLIKTEEFKLKVKMEYSK